LYFNSAVLQHYRAGKSNQNIRLALLGDGFAKHVAVVDSFLATNWYSSRGNALATRLHKNGPLKKRGPAIAKALLQKYSISEWTRRQGLQADCTYVLVPALLTERVSGTLGQQPAESGQA
jgi:hypothetical protein